MVLDFSLHLNSVSFIFYIHILATWHIWTVQDLKQVTKSCAESKRQLLA